MRLCARNLACTRGGRGVFRALHFTVDGGEMAAITGPNGSGKSSLLRLIAGLLRPEKGELVIQGGGADATIAEQAHYLGHQDALKPSLTVTENLSFWQAFLGGGGADLETSLLRVGLASLAQLPAHYLSAGQRRRLSLARLIATYRPIWLLDEPNSGLDAAAQAMLRDIMRAHLAMGGIIFAAVHESLGLQATHQLRLAGANEPGPGEAF